ncbi:MAG: protease complex subunit PrcB family protein [Roseburia sp.]|nr:protease complex subunit PrcB family protein [Roseburia sp.]
MLGGCSVETTNGTKVADLAYEIVEESDIPEEILTEIEEKKAADFKTSYELDGELYIVRGYGEQETGGYSICIRDCYLTSNAILFDTELVGPRKGEKVSASPSYPYLVIKMENRDESIIFE